MTFRYFIIMLLFLTIRSEAQIPDYVETINNFDDYHQLQGKPLSTKFGDVKSLTVVYNYQKDRLYFIHSLRYPYHLEFCESVLGYYKGSFNFNYDNYTKTEERDFLLANINFYPSDSLFTLEFSVADQIVIKDIEFLHQKLKDQFLLTDSIHLFLNTSQLEERFKQSKSKIPYVTVEDIYGNQSFQAIQTGRCYGRIQFASADDLSDVWPEDIVVLQGTPNELSLTQGVICNELQTPLSHVSILCKNRKTPFFALKNTQKELHAYSGLFVELKVGNYGYSIRSIPEDSVQHYLKDVLNIPLKHQLKRNNLDSALILVDDLSYNDITKVGAKAANFGELNRVSKKKNSRFKVPENALAVPFYHYLQHLHKSGVQNDIDSLLSLGLGQRNRQKCLLKKIRQAIKNTPVDTILVAYLNRHMVTDERFSRYRFRSSTNAEDIDGFNGAGLYSSTSAVLGDSIKTVERALKKVWASVWNDRAFFERLYFGIDQREVAMGVLVHRSFPNELANGVAITHNLYRPANLGFVINVQKGDISVVNPPYQVVCDQLICYSDTDNTFYNPKKIVEYISTSSETKDQHVLTDQQVVFLTKELAKVKKHFYRKVDKNWMQHDYQSFALDIEFKLDPSGDFYIKQARPF